MTVTTENINTYRGGVEITVSRKDSLKTLIGLGTIILLTYLFFTGALRDIMLNKYCSMNPNVSRGECQSGGMESGVYLFFQVVSGLSWLVGSVVLAFYSGIISILTMVYQLIADWSQTRRVENEQIALVQKNMEEQIGSQVASEVARVQKAQPTTLEGQLQELNARISRAASGERVKKELTLLNDKINELADHVGFVPPTPLEPMTMEKMQNTILELQKELAATKKPATRRRKTPVKKVTTNE
jgi:hypothetical protein